MNFPQLFISVIFSVMAVGSAEMVFETKLVEITLKPGQQIVTGTFPFKIEKGGATIVSYEAKCICLAARVEPLLPDRSPKLEWSKGESGWIMARFDSSQFRGTVEKNVEVQLLGQKEPVSLKVRIHVPELIKMEPKSLVWRKGEEAEEKVIKITINHDHPIRITKKSENNEKAFPSKLVTIREGWEYEIRVTPTDTTEAGMGMISLSTDSKFPRFKRVASYSSIIDKPKVKAACKD